MAKPEPSAQPDVRSALKADKPADVSLSPLCATSRHMQRSKNRHELRGFIRSPRRRAAGTLRGFVTCSRHRTCRMLEHSIPRLEDHVERRFRGSTDLTK